MSQGASSNPNEKAFPLSDSGTLSIVSASQLLRHCDALVFAVDKKKRVVSYNYALERLTGLREQDLIGCRVPKWLTVGGSGDPTELLPALERALNGEPVGHFEGNVPTIDGRTTAAVFTLASLADKKGVVETLVAVGQTSRRLQSMGAAALQTMRMTTMAAMAEGVLAELDDPVISIRAQAESLIEALEKSDMGEEALGSVKEILAGAKRLAKLTGDLISYARPGRRDLVSIQVNGLLEEALSLCSSQTAEKRARVRTAFAGELPTILGYPEALRQVFLNLITNAVQALGELGGRIVLRTWDNRNDSIGVSVSDDGSGIPEEIQPQVFEPFFTTRPHGGGMGLGLSLVRDVVGLHGGEVNIDSEPGEGTVITLTLPTKPHASP